MRVSTENIEHTFKAYITENGLGMGAVYLMRLILTGKGMGPSVFAIASLLGKDEVMTRYQKKLNFSPLFTKIKSRCNNVVQVHGIRTYSYHGCLEEEKVIGGNYIVDIDVFVTLDQPLETTSQKR